jgi:GNAT superfamily N-acetyltransferase
VFVAPEFRGRGYAKRVVAAAEAACAAAGIATLWLHTEHARGMYEKLGWVAVGPQDDWGHAVTLMRRDFG